MLSDIDAIRGGKCGWIKRHVRWAVGDDAARDHQRAIECCAHGGKVMMNSEDGSPVVCE